MPKSLTLSASLALAAACMGQAAHAQSLNYADFSAASLVANPALSVNGNAAVVGSALRLTPASSYQGGSAFSSTLIPLNNQESFSTEFSFQLSGAGGLGDEDGAGADGFVFTLQTVSNSVGFVGGGIGYQGLSPSIAVEFDTYNNGGQDNNDGNKITIDQNGDINVADALAYGHAPTGGAPDYPTRFNNGNVWYSWVDYNGATQQMDVRYSSVNVRPTTPFISATNLNLASVLGQPSAFVGFTAATGGGYENHDILSWQFKNTYSPIGVPTTVPEPSDLALLLCGVPLVAVALRRRRRA